ncbi:MAG: two-component system LytT family sensor kinase [Saprospiraceae bacterium]|jgi:two-component system LytT family sensor kinase
MSEILNKIKNWEHYILWMFMFLFVGDYHFYDGNWMEALRLTSIESGLYIIVFYFNYSFAIPYVSEKYGKFIYALLTFSFLILYILFIKIAELEELLYEGEYWRNIISMAINFSLFWMISTLLKIYQKSQKEEAQQLELKAVQLESELKFLKTQLSPHFIFNTLNNIYSLVKQGHENAAPMLAKLSAILRYVLYDSSRKKVFLEKEINTIKEYIELQLLRKPKSENIDFYKEGSISDLQIAPLLLINFVENCFKHGNIDKSEDAWIKISCISSADKKLVFTTENSKEGETKLTGKAGLGNGNVKRQLELYYPNKHQLEVAETKETFTVELMLDLS